MSEQKPMPDRVSPVCANHNILRKELVDKGLTGTCPDCDVVLVPDRVSPALCVNGDGRPICPPSKVICRECMDLIRQRLVDEIARYEGREVPNA
jgi:hypothetical protein